MDGWRKRTKEELCKIKKKLLTPSGKNKIKFYEQNTSMDDSRLTKLICNIMNLKRKK